VITLEQHRRDNTNRYTGIECVYFWPGGAGPPHSDVTSSIYRLLSRFLRWEPVLGRSHTCPIAVSSDTVLMLVSFRLPFLPRLLLIRLLRTFLPLLHPINNFSVSSSLCTPFLSSSSSSFSSSFSRSSSSVSSSYSSPSSSFYSSSSSTTFFYQFQDSKFDFTTR